MARPRASELNVAHARRTVEWLGGVAAGAFVVHAYWLMLWREGQLSPGALALARVSGGVTLAWTHAVVDALFAAMLVRVALGLVCGDDRLLPVASAGAWALCGVGALIHAGSVSRFPVEMPEAVAAGVDLWLVLAGNMVAVVVLCPIGVALTLRNKGGGRRRYLRPVTAAAPLVWVCNELLWLGTV